VNGHVYYELSTPVYGFDEAFHRWVTEDRIPAVLSIPGFVSARHFRCTDVPRSLKRRSPTYAFACMTRYEMEGEADKIFPHFVSAPINQRLSPFYEVVGQTLRVRAQQGDGSIPVDEMRGYVFRPITELLWRKSAPEGFNGQQFLYVVRSNPRIGQDDEFNDWYTNNHIHIEVELPGHYATQRFEISPFQFPSDVSLSRHGYVAEYWWDGDPRHILDELDLALAEGRLPHRSPAYDPEAAEFPVYAPLTDWLIAPGFSDTSKRP
jgi:hypothetical protein